MPATRCVPLPGCLLFGFVFVAVRLFSACNCCAVSWSTKLLAFTFSERCGVSELVRTVEYDMMASADAFAREDWWVAHTAAVSE